MTTREALHELVNTLPDDALPAAEASPTSLRDDPMERAWLTAPEDDEPLSDAERAMLDARMEAVRRGEVVPHEVVIRLIGN